MIGSGINKYLTVIAVFSLVISLGVPYGYALHLSDVTGVIDFRGYYHGPKWNLLASEPLVIGGYGDNFSYDGSMVRPVQGEAYVSLNTEMEKGLTIVKFNGSITPERGRTFEGDITLIYKVRRDGYQTGPGFREGGVADFVYLHGDTRQGEPVMPMTRAYVAAWGLADVFVDGRQVYDDLEGQILYTERMRDPDTWAVYGSGRKGFYNPVRPRDYTVFDPEDTELRFVVHSGESDSGNYPPNSVWIHLNFQNVKDVSAVN